MSGWHGYHCRDRRGERLGDGTAFERDRAADVAGVAGDQPGGDECGTEK